MTTAPTHHSQASQAREAPRAWLRFALPLLGLSVLIGAGGALAFWYLSDEIQRETHRTLAVIAEQKRQQIEELLAQHRMDAAIYFSGQAPLIQQFAHWLESGRQDSAGLAQMQTRLAELARIRGWDTLTILDDGGRPVLTLGQTDPGGLAAPPLDLLAQPETRSLDLHRDDRGAALYGVAAPIGPPEHPPLGLALLSWRADRDLYPLVESWPVPTHSAETYLVRRDGDRVSFLTPLRHEPAPALTLSRSLNAPDLPAARATQGERGILSGGRDYRGVPVLAYAAAVTGTPWLMIAEIDVREAYAGIRTAAWGTALVMGLGLLLVYSAGFQVWRRDRERHELAALQARQAAESRFRVVFEQAPLGVALRDAQTGRIVEANQGLADILGIPQSRLAGIDPLELTHPDDVAESRDRMGQLSAGEIPGYRLHKRYLRPDGTVVWASVICAPVKVEAEGAPRYLAIVEDISRRIRDERELQQASAAAAAANAAKSEFLAHMSHEIRTPLNAVLGLAQLLERESLPEHQHDMVAGIRTAGGSLLNILNDVLDLSKIEAGQLRIAPQPFELDAVLARLDSLLGQSARAKGLALHIEAPAEPVPRLCGDDLRLEQVLCNLIGNAIKFTEQGDVTLRIRTLTDDARTLRLRFEVQDPGIGIPPEVIPSLFAPFTQAEAGIARRFGGTGLGLAISKRLVSLMGGEIGVESQPGRGSTFWFELPFERTGAATAPPAACPGPRAPAGQRLQGAHLLVVDDSALNRDLVARALGQEGARVTLAADGQQALEQLRNRPEAFDAVLMDVRMPIMDGLTATGLIRGELGLTDLPIIAFTAGVLPEQQEAARAAGASDVLAKPLDLETMTGLLARWVGPPLEDPLILPDPGQAKGRGSGGFPEIAGIDRELASRRLGGDRAMFLGLLGLFVSDFADGAEETRHDLARGDPDAATRRLHTLRGSAGMLGARDLMAVAGALEQAIAGGKKDLDGPLGELARLLAELETASAPWRDGDPPAS